ncbi:MAG: hypothetical protein ABUL53_13520 [Bradyrhizobium guangdongense]
MIKDQVTFSARAENSRKILRNLVALTLGSVAALTPYAAFGAETTSPLHTPGGGFEQIALPPIPHLDTMPWLNWPSAPSAMKVDTLLSPVLDPPRLRFDRLPTHRDGTPPATS